MILLIIYKAISHYIFRYRLLNCQFITKIENVVGDYVILIKVDNLFIKHYNVVINRVNKETQIEINKNFNQNKIVNFFFAKKYNIKNRRSKTEELILSRFINYIENSVISNRKYKLNKIK